MPDLLIELLSEEIPARMQARAADDLKKLVTDKLVAAGLLYEGAKSFVTPRRLALAVAGVPARQADVKEERRGPRVGAPEGAIQGFLKAAGLKSIGEAKVEQDARKGDFYVAVIEKKGRPAIEVIAEIVPEVVKTFPWPKSMRWGARSAQPGALGWVRPLHSIVATFGPETETPEIVPFSVDGIAASDVTQGHRFLAPKPFKVRRLDDYAAKLEKAKVVLDPERRKEIILADAKNLAFAQGCELVEDLGLLAEVAGLVEWPVVLMGAFDAEFLSIPSEVIRATIRNNQKCFVLRAASPFETPARKSGLPDLRTQEVPDLGYTRDRARAPQGEAGQVPHPKTRGTKGPHPEEARSAVSKDGSGHLVNKFILVANTEAKDGGKAIVAGNERVIRARLADAKFFYETDLRIKLEDRLPKFKQIVFHEKLGTQWERIERIERLAGELAPVVGADVAEAKRAASLAKADLLTEVVGEFPELQGLMGKYYALAQGEDLSIAAACEDHYKPLGPNDRVPDDPVSVAVALADKIDMLVSFWAIDEKPTGSKDPFGLRRAALGVIRLLLENDLRIDLTSVLKKHSDQFPNHDWALTTFGVIEFIGDRLKVQLREQGARYDLVDAVFQEGIRRDEMMPGMGNVRDLVLIVRRVEALGKFLDTEDGKNLLAGYKRATNIIRIEEKKDAREYVGRPDPSLYRQDEEWALARAIDAAKEEAGKAVAAEDFSAAMRAMATLRRHVDAFFDRVTVNVAEGADKAKLRENRLKLLNEIREATRAVADFSKIEG